MFCKGIYDVLWDCIEGEGALKVYSVEYIDYLSG